MKIALIGNPNSGKSSVFNMLTGLRQKIGNFPGVTVEKKTGTLLLDSEAHTLIDFPGTYSIYPHSKDEEVVSEVLKTKTSIDYPDLAIVVVDATNIDRHLLLFSQIVDLGIPSILVVNMTDLAEKKGIIIDFEKLRDCLPNIPVVPLVARVGLGKDRLMAALSSILTESKKPTPFIEPYLPCEDGNVEGQETETRLRFEIIKPLISACIQSQKETPKASKIDKWLTHPIWGYVILATILFLIFQSIFSFASYPMQWIESGMSWIGGALSSSLPAGLFTDLLVNGLIPGIGGVLIFVPQIALLFFFIAILEETGYLTRVVFIMDRLLKPFGLNGRSVVPLISSMACAIPGIMSTRNIPDWKERMITIFVAPLMSCSARIPVYALLISLVIPNTYVFGVINLQGLVFFGLYFLGIFSALFLSLVLKRLLKSQKNSFLLLELPSYKKPSWKNIGIYVFEKAKVFIFDAGKVIVAISIILWALASYGPSGRRMETMQKLKSSQSYIAADSIQKLNLEASSKLESSYIGLVGKTIEPLIQPLGYDWKIGIALVTSFAAREVFVGSLSTIYSVHQDDSNKSLRDKMKSEVRSNGRPLYTLASGLSLMVFYAYAMQCMSTLAVVRRETKSWIWPLAQTLVLGILAYLMALITFMIFK